MRWISRKGIPAVDWARGLSIDSATTSECWCLVYIVDYSGPCVCTRIISLIILSHFSSLRSISVCNLGVILFD